MKMNYRVATAAVTAALSLSLLAGCGAQSSSSAAASSSSSAPAATQTTSSSSSAAASSSSASSSSAAADTTNASSSSTQQAQPAEPGTEISPEEAKAIALADAGFSEADVTALSVELDRYDAVSHYDVDFKANGMEYDYDIALANGSILQAKSEVDD